MKAVDDLDAAVKAGAGADVSPGVPHCARYGGRTGNAVADDVRFHQRATDACPSITPGCEARVAAKQAHTAIAKRRGISGGA